TRSKRDWSSDVCSSDLDDRRIIKGWTDEERKELEEYKKEPKLSMLKVFYDLFSGYEFYPNLCKKARGVFGAGGINQENQFVNDVVDYFNDRAVFSEQKYYVHFIKNDVMGYLNCDYGERFFTADKNTDDGYNTQFTKS